MKKELKNLQTFEQRTDKKLNISDVMNSVLDDLEKLVSKYDKAQKNAVDEFDDNVNYGKVRALKEAIEVVKKHCS
jgi:DNA-binding ferritin-like protein